MGVFVLTASSAPNMNWRSQDPAGENVLKLPYALHRRTVRGEVLQKYNRKTTGNTPFVLVLLFFFYSEPKNFVLFFSFCFMDTSEREYRIGYSFSPLFNLLPNPRGSSQRQRFISSECCDLFCNLLFIVIIFIWIYGIYLIVLPMDCLQEGYLILVGTVQLDDFTILWLGIEFS